MRTDAPKPIRRAPLKSFPRLPRRHPTHEARRLINQTIGEFIQHWSELDDTISGAIDRLEQLLVRHQKITPDAATGTPARYDDRFKKFEALVRKWCTAPQGLADLAALSSKTKVWVNLRNDLVHGKVEPYIAGDEFEGLRLLITPSKGRKLRPDLAYTISFLTLLQGLTNVFAGYGGTITGIYFAVWESIDPLLQSVKADLRERRKRARQPLPLAAVVAGLNCAVLDTYSYYETITLTRPPWGALARHRLGGAGRRNGLEIRPWYFRGEPETVRIRGTRGRTAFRTRAARGSTWTVTTDLPPGAWLTVAQQARHESVARDRKKPQWTAERRASSIARGGSTPRSRRFAQTALTCLRRAG